MKKLFNEMFNNIENIAKEQLLDLKQNNIVSILENENIKEENKKVLIENIKEIDFSNIKNMQEQIKDIEIKEEKVSNINYIDKYKLDEDVVNEYIFLAKEAIKNNEYALITMAGGQGTRLGFDGPKGSFKIKVYNGEKSLFEILAEKIKSINNKYDINLNWYIMTSKENNDETIKHFEDNNYFELDRKNIIFFIQTDMPMLLEDGNIIINEDFSIKKASDGNGAIYKCLKDSGILNDLKERNIKYVLIGSIDNALLNIEDEIFIGAFIKAKEEIASKSVVKISPEERVGVFCKKDGKPSVIEYTELDDSLRYEKDEKGELLYGEAHLMINLYKIKALEKLAEIELPYHIAYKKSDYLDGEGKLVTTDKPNAYKFEKLIFDGFSFFDNILIMRGKREEDFAPIKNKEGDDSPETAIKLYNDYYKKN